MNAKRTLSLVAAASALAAFGTAAHADNGVPDFNKIVVVIEENHDFGELIGNSPNAPYTKFLAQNGALFTQSYGVEHPSQPNYLDLFSGSDQGIYNDNNLTTPTNPFTTDHLGAELFHNGKTFAGYSEGLPSVGSQVYNAPFGPNNNPKDYARKHNPWADWQATGATDASNSPTSNLLPASVNQPLTPFTNADGNYQSLPDVSIVVPDQEDDDHNVSGPGSAPTDADLIQDGDTWLKDNLQDYATWAKTHNSLLIVTWDEDDYAGTNQIPTIFYGADVKTGQYSESQDTSEVSLVNGDGQPSGAPNFHDVQGINHFNILRTIEDAEGVGYAGASANAAPITDAFVQPTPEPATVAPFLLGALALGAMAYRRRKSA
jgi:acid phosphatase